MQDGSCEPGRKSAEVQREKESKEVREESLLYASRKAYAESRPRVKGQFASKLDVELELD